ncbi:ribonuclease HII [Streptomyces alkaliphilus]|uniref:ribonuclease HII n=1 Tax=Streptomyces alkaliphilus TaxID=1472722 RepID=UPI00118048F2|nr:ribonuclease HII [Streptomyces alkaliphilus]MQS06681.1 ribonuclease HII [Streptomyces alkaliphilus]
MTTSPGAPTTDRPAAPRVVSARPVPAHTVERSLRARTGARLVAGIDEVGRGAWAGPVTVCAAVTGLRRPPEGLTDSKLLTPARRVEMAARLEEWVTAGALGHASPEEIDALGMTAALRLAAVRALEALPERPDAVILDGSHDYLGAPWTVRTVVKGDLSCVPVAAASVLAKVDRDARLAELGREHPDFAFERNAGYPSPVHRAALERLGPTPHHRLSWSYLDALPRWRHLRRPAPVPPGRPRRTAPAGPPAGQLGMF